MFALALLLTDCVTCFSSGGIADALSGHLSFATRNGCPAMINLGDPIPGETLKIEWLTICAFDNNFAALETTFVTTENFVPANVKACKDLLPSPPLALRRCTWSFQRQSQPLGTEGAHRQNFLLRGRLRPGGAKSDRMGFGVNSLLANLLSGISFQMIPNCQWVTF